MNREYAHGAQSDLMLLDAMLSQMGSFTVRGTLQQQPVVLIVMLNVGSNDAERVKDVAIGGDDYLVKPFSFWELVARMQPLLRCCGPYLQRSPSSDRIAIGDIVLDRTARQVWRAGRLIEMSPREYDLLCVLMENAGRPVSRQQLLDQVWGEGWIGDHRSLNVHIYWLRQKLEDDPAAPRYIQTVRGYGYRFTDPTTSPTDAA